MPTYNPIRALDRAKPNDTMHDTQDLLIVAIWSMVVDQQHRRVAARKVLL
jgi:hypothetical protein